MCTQYSVCFVSDSFCCSFSFSSSSFFHHRHPLMSVSLLHYHDVAWDEERMASWSSSPSSTHQWWSSFTSLLLVSDQEVQHELNEKDKGMKEKQEIKGREEEQHKSLHGKSCLKRGMERDGKMNMLMIRETMDEKRKWYLIQEQLDFSSVSSSPSVSRFLFPPLDKAVDDRRPRNHSKTSPGVSFSKRLFSYDACDHTTCTSSSSSPFSFFLMCMKSMMEGKEKIFNRDINDITIIIIITLKTRTLEE